MVATSHLAAGDDGEKLAQEVQPTHNDQTDIAGLAVSLSAAAAAPPVHVSPPKLLKLSGK